MFLTLSGSFTSAFTVPKVNYLQQIADVYRLHWKTLGTHCEYFEGTHDTEYSSWVPKILISIKGTHDEYHGTQENVVSFMLSTLLTDMILMSSMV